MYLLTFPPAHFLLFNCVWSIYNKRICYVTVVFLSRRCTIHFVNSNSDDYIVCLLWYAHATMVIITSVDWLYDDYFLHISDILLFVTIRLSGYLIGLVHSNLWWGQSTTSSFCQAYCTSTQSQLGICCCQLNWLELTEWWSAWSYA